jgi:hypothetical protein
MTEVATPQVVETAPVEAAPAVEAKQVATPEKKSPPRRPLSNLFTFVRKHSHHTEPAAEQTSEKVNPIVPGEPVQPATIDVGPPVTAEEAKSVPGVVTGETAPTETADKSVDVDKPATSPKKDNLFDKVKHAMGLDKKPVKKPSGDEAETKAEAAPTETTESTVLAESTEVAAPTESTLDATTEETTETKPVNPKIARRLSARLFGGLTPKKREDKKEIISVPAKEAAVNEESVAKPDEAIPTPATPVAETAAAPIAPALEEPKVVEPTPTAVEEPVKPAESAIASETPAAPVATVA